MSEDRAFERVGGNQTLHADVRIIAATNKNLEQMVREGENSATTFIFPPQRGAHHHAAVARERGKISQFWFADSCVTSARRMTSRLSI
jgi:hypothetical protein